MNITMVHSNPVRVSGGRLTVDRKFHLGMLQYIEHLKRPVATVNPNLREGQPIMDPVELSTNDLPYEVVNLDADVGSVRVLPHEHERIARHIGNSAIVYGTGLSSAEIARRMRVPYVQILEYDLDTKLRIISAEARDPVRRLVRSVRCVRDHWLEGIPDMRGAHSLHCNGYPIFDATRRHNKNRVLYLDSRMTAEQVITREAIQERLSDLERRPLRLLYSGRYERVKGADDVVRIAVECLERGLQVELDCYGQGRLGEEMQRLAGTRSTIRIHGAVPYPELVKISQGADIFVCCHIQNDPSCTYLESMGAGLPIVGYANRMWRRLQETSGAGLTAPLGDVSAMVDLIAGLRRDPKRLEQLSWKARDFAVEHSFEREFGKRIRALIGALGEGASA